MEYKEGEKISFDSLASLNDFANQNLIGAPLQYESARGLELDIGDTFKIDSKGPLFVVTKKISGTHIEVMPKEELEMIEALIKARKAMDEFDARIEKKQQQKNKKINGHGRKQQFTAFGRNKVRIK